MFKCFMENLKSICFKTVTILLIEAMIFSSIPFGAGAVEIASTSSIQTNQSFILGKISDVPLIMSYSIDTKENLLVLNWNRLKNDVSKYYVLCRKSGELTYDLASVIGGIRDTYWTGNINDWKSRYFIICDEKAAKKIAGSKYIITDYSKISNQVFIDETSLKKPVRPEFVNYVKGDKEATLTWGMRDSTGISYFLVYEKSKTNGDWIYIEKYGIHIDKKY